MLSPLKSVSSASRLPGRYRVETLTRWVTLPSYLSTYWSRRDSRYAHEREEEYEHGLSSTRTSTENEYPGGSATHLAQHGDDASKQELSLLNVAKVGGAEEV